MGRRKDLTGQRFGRLIVIEYSGNSKWICQCDCGTITKPIYGQSLKGGKTKSCGCLLKEASSERNKKDLQNMTFGELTVVKECGRDAYSNIIWECKCECGNITYVVTRDLLNGHTTSCGHCNDIKIGDKFGRLTILDKHGIDKNSGKTVWSCKCDCGNTKFVIGSELKSGHTKSCGCLKKEMVGTNHPNYNPNLTEEERELKKEGRTSDSDFVNWSRQIKEQANFTCDICGQHGHNLNSHHLNSWNIYKEQRYDLENGVCLCEQCHKEFHKLYGKGGNTKEQYIEFKENKLTKQEQ